MQPKPLLGTILHRLLPVYGNTILVPLSSALLLTISVLNKLTRKMPIICLEVYILATRSYVKTGLVAAIAHTIHWKYENWSCNIFMMSCPPLVRATQLQQQDTACSCHWQLHISIFSRQTTSTRGPRDFAFLCKCSRCYYTSSYQ
jgi:hypothetical protein